MIRVLSFIAAAVLVSCTEPEPVPPKPEPAPPHFATYADEIHLKDIRQLTFGGQNAEAYWSHDGTQLIYQGRSGQQQCDAIYRLRLADNPPKPVQVSSGKGTTTCSYFLPGDQDILYASTHLGGDACPPAPDRSHGYVWALYDTYDIFRAKADGSGVMRLTDTPGYDAEGTVCPKDGSIVFTSVRDGDIDLYRMDADGKNVKRLTFEPGYDGGAFFNHDCTKIVWRASRPKGKDLEDYRALLKQGLVRPTRLELYVANADGTEPHQVTYLNAASFAPYWFPDSHRIIFSSNYGDPKGREFNLWAINEDGTDLEQITSAPGFDGFPMFSPDGSLLAFASNRATPPGLHDTNVFVARWDSGPPRHPSTAADRIHEDVSWLADKAREGRGIGTPGLEAAGHYLERRFSEMGVSPAGDKGFAQPFPVTTAVRVGDGTSLTWLGAPVDAAELRPLAFSSSAKVEGRVVLAGYGISAPELGADDYAKLDVRGQIVLVRRFVPDGKPFDETDAQRRHGDIRRKAWVAREHGAKALIVVDVPVPPKDAPKDWKGPDEAGFPSLFPEGATDSGIPVLVVKRASAQRVLEALEKKQRVDATVTVKLDFDKSDAFNVVGRITSTAPQSQRLPGVVVVGAHYDHLGYGGPNSLAPDKHEPHLGADDNASGTAALLEVARTLTEHRGELVRDVVLVAFSGEEAGVLGSTHFTRQPPAGLAMKDVVAMLNMDMVGRLRANKLSVLGTDSAQEWTPMVDAACADARVECTTGGDGYGPSDQTPFYASGLPVLFFFTGAHSDYHKPSDVAERINAAGAAQVAQIAARLAQEVGARAQHLTYKSVPSPAPLGDLRSFNASLGTIPDYAGPPNGQKGVLLSGVRAGGGADKAGMRRGDILVRLGNHEVGSVEDFMYALNAHKPGETVTAVVLRDGKEVKLEATFQESHRR